MNKIVYKWNTNINQIFGNDCYKKSEKEKSIYDLLCGVELELESKNHPFLEKRSEEASAFLSELSRSHVYRENENFIFCKEDWSMQMGLEIVSLPATIEHHRINWAEILTKIKEKNKISKSALRPASTTGCHVHISKKDLSNLCITKILKFIYDMDNYKFLTEVSERVPPKKYCNFRVISCLDKIGERFRFASNTQHRYGNYKNDPKYEALNIKNGQTIEFRFFKSTLNYYNLMKNIDFCYSLVDFCNSCNLSLQDICLTKYIKFVESKRKAYPFMFYFLIKKGYLNEYYDKRKLSKYKINKYKKINISRCVGFHVDNVIKDCAAKYKTKKVKKVCV